VPRRRHRRRGYQEENGEGRQTWLYSWVEGQPEGH
jgi:hypothetical protein